MSNRNRNKQVADEYDVSAQTPYDEQEITDEMRAEAQRLLGIDDISTATNAEIWDALTADYRRSGSQKDIKMRGDDVLVYADDDDETFDDDDSDAIFDEMIADDSVIDVELYKKPTHRFPTGVVVELQPVAPMAVEYLQSNEVGKPEPPRLYNGKYRPPVPEKVREREDGEQEAYLDYADPVWIQAYEAWIEAHRHRIKMSREIVDDHPEYMKALREWQSNKQRKLVRYLAIKGVKTMPPQEYQEEAAIYMPSESSLNDLKYMWIMEQLPHEDAISDFYEAVAGVTMPTKDGIDEAKKN